MRKLVRNSGSIAADPTQESKSKNAVKEKILKNKPIDLSFFGKNKADNKLGINKDVKGKAVTGVKQDFWDKDYKDSKRRQQGPSLTAAAQRKLGTK